MYLKTELEIFMVQKNTGGRSDLHYLQPLYQHLKNNFRSYNIQKVKILFMITRNGISIDTLLCKKHSWTYRLFARRENEITPHPPFFRYILEIKS